MRTLFLFVLMALSFTTLLFAEGDNAILAAEKIVWDAEHFIKSFPDFSKNFFVESLLVLKRLSISLEALEKKPSTKSASVEKEVRRKMLELALHVLRTGFFADEEKALSMLNEKPSTILVPAYKNKLEACQLEALKAVENAPKLVAQFKETELWCRPALFDNAKELLQILYRARLVNSEKANDALVAYMVQVARVVALRTWRDRTRVREDKIDPRKIFTSASSVIRVAKAHFEKFNRGCESALRFLATDFSEKDASVVLTEARTCITDLHAVVWVMPSEIRDTRILSLARKIMEKVLVFHKLNPELYLSAIQEQDIWRQDVPGGIFFEYTRILEDIASGKRRPDWAKPAIALDELEKAYRWYEPHREMQNYISEVMLEVQKLVHDTGSAELKGRLLREVVMVIHGFHEEKAITIK